MIQDELKNAIKKALRKMSIKVDDIEFEYPANLDFGDYSTNVAMVHAKKINENPVKLAEKIVRELNKTLSPSTTLGTNCSKQFERIEIAGNGFINFYLSKTFFTKILKEILNKDEDYGRNKNLNGEKIMIEFTDPNPFKEFHIGHLMSNIIGESIARLVEFSGAKVKRANYQGDVGLHIAKAVWGIKKMKNEMPGGKTDLAQKIKFLGRAYSLGAKEYEIDSSAKKEMNEINKYIYENKNSEIKKIYKWGREISLRYFEIIYEMLGTKFDFYFFESKAGKLGEKLVKKFSKKGLFEKSQGAIVFKGEKYGLHTRVFCNSDGIPTYEAKELGLAKLKYRKYRYDKSIVITGNEINDYFKVLLKVMSFVYPKLAERTKHIGHGMLRLPEGKMSSRTGDVVPFVLLFDYVYKKIHPMVKREDMSEDEKIETSEKISVAVLKYQILKQQLGKNIIFDFNKSLSFEGDSGPYLLYTYVRAKSVLNNADKIGLKVKIRPTKEENIILERFLSRFPETVERASREYSPHYVANYLVELASAFNNYYAKNKIIDSGDLAEYRLALTKAVSIVLRNGLDALGIEIVEKM